MSLHPGGYASTRVRVALAVAALWSVGLLVAGLTVPVYDGSTTTTTSDGTTVQTSTSATLVGVNGGWALLVLGVPLLATLVVGLLLAVGPTGRAPRAVAWTVVGLCGLMTVLGALTVGILLLPVTVALAVAVAGAAPANTANRSTVVGHAA